MNQVAKDITKFVHTELDKACKEVLKNIPFLARIVQASVREYADCTIEEVENLIRGNQMTNKIVGQAESMNGRQVDIRFDAKCPNGDGMTKVLLNIEVQNKYTPGYDLITRGIFYGALMLAAEDGVEFEGQNYGDLKKVYSIWIAIRPRVSERGCINCYEMNEVQLRGTMTRAKSVYDKLSVVQLNLGAADDDGVLRMLDVLMDHTCSIEDKKVILGQEYGIVMNDEMEGDVESVCNYSEWVYENGVEKGIAQGIQKGIAQMLMKAMKKTKGSIEEVLEYFDIPEDERAMYAEQLRKKV